MAEYTTKKEKLIVPGSVIKEYNKTKPSSQIFGTDFAGDQYYDYRLNTETGVTEIFRDSPFKIFDRKNIGTIDNKTKKVELNDNATEFENFYFNKNDTKNNIIKINQKNLIDNGLSAKQVDEILPTNQAKSGTDEDSTSGFFDVQPTDNSRKKYENLCYPVTLRRGNQDRLKITILDRDLRNSRRLSGKRIPAKSIGSVVLPVPGNLRDDNKVDFKNGTLNPLEVAAAEVALTALLNPSATGSEVKSLFDQVVSAGGDLKSLTAALFTGRAINRTGNEIAARAQGAIVNPNLELLFNGPTLRPFNFQFRLSPRDRGESIEIRKIIRMFKQSSAVRSTASNFFLRAPNTYKLQFFEGSSTFSSDHAFLPKIKECALLGFSVNYTPDGTFMSYENSSMVSYDVTFAFQEIDPITNEDYTLLDSNSDNSIGF